MSSAVSWTAEVSPEIYAQNIGVYLIMTKILMIFVSELAHDEILSTGLSPDCEKDVKTQTLKKFISLTYLILE